MKVFYVYFLLCALSVNAQRRLAKHESSDSEPTSQKSIRSRGRTRFAISPEFETVSEDYDFVKKSQFANAPRRKPEQPLVSERKHSRPAQDAIFNRRSYEVREIIDDIPRDIPPRLKKKPHVITETKFEAANVSPKELITPTPLPAVDTPVSKPDEPVALPSPSSEKPTEASVDHSSAATPEPQRKPTESSEIRRIHPRARNARPKIEEPAVIKSRSKPARKQAEVPSTASTPTQRSNYRTNRRRPEPTAETTHDVLRTKGPSVFSAESQSNRARTERKVIAPTNEDATENVVVLRRRPNSERRRPKTIDTSTQLSTEEPQRVQLQSVANENVAKIEPRQAPRRTESRRSRFSTSTEIPSQDRAPSRSSRRNTTPRVEVTTQRSQRSRYRTTASNKEENASVVTTPTRAYFSRRRQPDTIDDIDAASTKQTEVKIKYVPPSEPRPPNVRVSLQKSVSVETQPGRVVRKRLHHVRKSSARPNEIVESTPHPDVVDAPRKFDLLNLKANDERGPRPSQQSARKQSRNNVNGDSRNDEKLSSSQESIDESDNYPAPFKAAIFQAKKKKHGLLGSRTKNANEASVTKTAETTTVTSSISSTSLKNSFPNPDVVTSTTLKTVELASSTSRSSRYPRPRFSLTTKQPKHTDGDQDTRRHNSYKSKYSKPTTNEAISSSTTEKYHARYFSKIQNDIDATLPPKPIIKTRNYIPKPPKGIYSSRRPSPVEEKPIKIETASLSTKIPPVGLSARNRFSARYRNEILPKSVAHRASTNIPSYIPTVPTVTPSTSTIKIEDTVDGLEVISFYDPVANTVPSDNLVNGNAEVSDSATNNSTAQTTERALTFIERIINSITAISTTTSPDSTSVTTTDGQTTKSSAILNLVGKRSKDLSLDKTVLTNLQNSTTEKPTTIIEQILSSLSVIKADSSTIDSNQVGTTPNLFSTQTSAQILENVGTTPLSINNFSSSDATTFVSTTSVSSTAPFTETVPSDDLNTISPLSDTVKPLLLSLNSGTEERLSAATSEAPKPIDNTPKEVVNVVFPINSRSAVTDETSTPMLYTSALDLETVPVTENPQVSQIVAAVSKIVASTLEPSTESPSSTTPQATTIISSSNNDVKPNPITTELPFYTLTDSEINMFSGAPSTDIQSALSDDALPSTTQSSIQNVSETTLDLVTENQISTLSTASVSSSSTDVESSSLVSMETSTVITVTPSSSTTETLVSNSVDPIVTNLPSTATQTVTGPYPPPNLVTDSTVARTTGSVTSVTDEKSIETNQPTSTTMQPSTRLTVTGPYPNSESTASVFTDTTTTSTTLLTESTKLNLESTTPSVTPEIIPLTLLLSSQFPDAGTKTDTTTFSSTSVDSTTTSITQPSTASSTSTEESTQSPSFSSEFPYPSPPALSTMSSSVSDSTTTMISPQTTTLLPPLPYTAAKTDTTVKVFTTDNTVAMSSTQSTIPSSTVTVLPSSETTLQNSFQTTTSSSQFSYPGTGSISTAFSSPQTTIASLQFPYPALRTGDDLIVQSSTISEVSVTPFTTSFTTTLATPTTSEQKLDTITTEDSSTVPSVSNFEVSPDRVSIYSPNDISSTFSPEESASTISISGRVLTTTTSSKPYPNTEPSTISTTTSNSSTTNTPDDTSQDVSSNTINTNSDTDKTDVTNLVNQLSLTTNVVEATTASTTQLPTMPIESTTSTTSKPVAMATSTAKPVTMQTEPTSTVTQMNNREEKRLRFEIPPPTNDVSEPPEKDYFIFAVLQNNTILRKRPSRFPNKNTPFLIYGVLPNNTLIQKFPNGTVVPMEPVIQVNGFDTRDYPSTAPALISNQVTTNEEAQRNNNAVPVESNVEVNELSTGSSSTPSPLPPLIELLGDKTVRAFNGIVNQTKDEQMNKVQTLDVDPLLEDQSRKTDAQSSSTTSTSTTTPATTTSTTTAATTTSTTTAATTTSTTTAATTTSTTTEATTISNVDTTTTTTAPFTSPPEQSTVTPTSTAAVPKETATPDGPTTIGLPPSLQEEDIEANALAISIPVDSSSTITPQPIPVADLLTKINTIPTPTVVSIKDLKVDESKLNDQQKQDLQILRALEREQEAILKQLAFLTKLNLSGTKSDNVENLANRVVAQAVENTAASTLVETSNRQSKKISDPAVEKIVNDINANGFGPVTPTNSIVSSTYGKTNDALLASLLKEYGVGPTTPKGFADVFSKVLLTTTKPPTRKPTTQAPGPIMQGLNWLLNTLSPQPSPKPKPKPKPTPQQIKSTTATPTTTKLPESKPRNTVITDKHLEALIQQLEAIQKDPKKAKNIDIEALRKLQSMTRITEGMMALSSTTTQSSEENELKPVVINRGGVGQSSTPLPLSVPSSVDNINLQSTASTAKPTRIPPVKLNPVPGVSDGSPKIQGQLVNYAINITKAISSFLGTALQDASDRFVNILKSGSGASLFNANYTGTALPSSSII